MHRPLRISICVAAIAAFALAPQMVLAGYLITDLGAGSGGIAGISVTTSSEASSAVGFQNSGILYSSSDSHTDEHIARTSSTGLNGTGAATGWADSYPINTSGGAMWGAACTFADANTSGYFRGVEVVSSAFGGGTAHITGADPVTLFLIFARPAEAFGNPAEAASLVQVDTGLSYQAPIFSSSAPSGELVIPDLFDFYIRAGIGINTSSSTINFSTDPNDPSQTPPDDVNQALNGIAAVWGLNSLPGSIPLNPLLPRQVAPFRDVIGEAADSVWVTTFPVTESYGQSNFIYIDPDYASGYSYHVDGSAFASFTIPGALPGGDDLFNLTFGDVSLALGAVSLVRGFRRHFGGVAGRKRRECVGGAVDRRLRPLGRLCPRGR